MIRIARINLWTDQGESITMEHAARDLLGAAGLTPADVWLHGTDYSNHTHYGNWVLVPVKDLPQLANLPPMPDGHTNRVDYRQTIIEAADIAALTVGQRIKVQHEGGFGGWLQDEGKVLRKDTMQIDGAEVPYVAILAKGKRTKGWEIRTGDRAEITVIEKGQRT